MFVKTFFLTLFATVISLPLPQFQPHFMPLPHFQPQPHFMPQPQLSNELTSQNTDSLTMLLRSLFIVNICIISIVAVGLIIKSVINKYAMIGKRFYF